MHVFTLSYYLEVAVWPYSQDKMDHLNIYYLDQHSQIYLSSITHIYTGGIHAFWSTQEASVVEI